MINPVAIVVFVCLPDALDDFMGVSRRGSVVNRLKSRKSQGRLCSCRASLQVVYRVTPYLLSAAPVVLAIIAHLFHRRVMSIHLMPPKTKKRSLSQGWGQLLELLSYHPRRVQKLLKSPNDSPLWFIGCCW